MHSRSIPEIALALLAFVVGFASIQQPTWSASLKSGDVIATGDVLPDGTEIAAIFSDPGLNSRGDVAFRGLTGDGHIAIFTQKGVVIKEGDVFPDGTTLASISGITMTINERGEIPFAGQTTIEAFKAGIFTEGGIVAAAGDILPDGTTVLGPGGEPSINSRGDIAFGSAISGPASAILTQKGVVVQAPGVLPDGNTLLSFEVIGHINTRGLIPFTCNLADGHGICTQDGVVVKEGDTLPDGTTVGHIGGRPMISSSGKVAFLAFSETVAICTQDGVVVKEGDTLPDGTTVESIISTPDINAHGTVVFLGLTSAGSFAILSQNGAVVTAGDTLPDGTTVRAISSAPVINSSGQVAFLGRLLDLTFGAFLVK